jgi:hypothetical protein
MLCYEVFFSLFENSLAFCLYDVRSPEVDVFFVYLDRMQREGFSNAILYNSINSSYAFSGQSMFRISLKLVSCR